MDNVQKVCNFRVDLCLQQEMDTFYMCSDYVVVACICDYNVIYIINMTLNFGWCDFWDTDSIHG
jgi:hypothetical protein